MWNLTVAHTKDSAEITCVQIELFIRASKKTGQIIAKGKKRLLNYLLLNFELLKLLLVQL